MMSCAPDPSMRRRNVRTAASAISASGIRTVVRPGFRYAPIGGSWKPIPETSSGTRRPALAIAAIAPTAAPKLDATTAVGRGCREEEAHRVEAAGLVQLRPG